MLGLMSILIPACGAPPVLSIPFLIIGFLIWLVVAHFFDILVLSVMGYVIIHCFRNIRQYLKNKSPIDNMPTIKNSIPKFLEPYKEALLAIEKRGSNNCRAYVPNDFLKLFPANRYFKKENASTAKLTDKRDNLILYSSKFP